MPNLLGLREGSALLAVVTDHCGVESLSANSRGPPLEKQNGVRAVRDELVAAGPGGVTLAELLFGVSHEGAADVGDLLDRCRTAINVMGDLAFGTAGMEIETACR